MSVPRKAKTGKTRARKTISREELHRLAFCNSARLPRVVEMDGQRYQWVGIGWVNEGEPRGNEVFVTD